MSVPYLEVRVKSVTYEAERINSYDLRLRDGGALPPFTAGAHVNVRMRGNSTRSYSLVNSQHERHRYVIAVALDEAGSGGSRHIHGRVRAGDLLQITPPANDFRLVEEAPCSVLIAGGIGITPIWCMVQRLTSLNRPWALHYAARTRGAAAFLDELSRLPAGQIHLHIDAEANGQVIDVAAIVKRAPADAHLYCCGPAGLLAAFEQAASTRAPAQVHVEYFKAKNAPARRHAYTVVLAKARREILVQTGQTLLDALLDAGLDPARSCVEGVCGACEVRVIDGIPDHRDMVLTDAERAANRTMMICCSGSCSERLVLDL
ncbi:MAG: oxidoreductase [Betaproteobacteria bacterium]|nr:oxidoreductase [Betaproteobacteria bacterium]